MEATGTGTRRRLSSDERRELIEEAARAVFAEYGYHAASIGEIAARSGITKATLYDHFPSKEALHLELLREQRDELLRIVTPTLEGGGSAEERVRRALDGFYAYVHDNPYAWRMLFRETTGDPEIADAHRQIQAEAHAAVVGTLLKDPEVCRALGPLSQGEKGLLAATIGGATHGAARWWWDNKSTPRSKVVRMVMRVLWDGLGPQTT